MAPQGVLPYHGGHGHLPLRGLILAIESNHQRPKGTLLAST